MANYCPYCGNAITQTGPYCQKCGKDLRQFGPVVTPSSTLGALEDLKKYSQLRSRTDKIIPTWWVLVPALTIAISISTVVIFFISSSSLFRSFAPGTTTTPSTAQVTSLPIFHDLEYVDVASLVILILFLFLIYNLISRRNQHFERQERVFYDASYILKQAVISRKGQLSSEDSNNFLRIESVANTMSYAEKPKSALLWVVLLFVPLVDVFAYFYIFYFLMRDFSEHERNEDYLVQIFSYIGSSLGARPISGRSKKMSDRSFILYFILLLVTLGIFGIYWVYVLIKDPNEHFVGDASIESELLAMVSALSSTPSRQV
jgi:hypothetical protein